MARSRFDCQLAEIEMITDLPVRRARLWAYLAERVLADRNHILVRYEDLATDPLGQLARILDGLPVGTLREPIEPGEKSSRREVLDASDHDAIATLCKSAGEALGVYDPSRMPAFRYSERHFPIAFSL